MKNWWVKLQQREQTVILIGSFILILAFLYFVIWSQIVLDYNNKASRVDNKRETLNWISQRKEELEHLKRINPNLFNQATDNRSLLAIVDASAKQIGTHSSITQIDPDGENKVSVWVENISFDHLIILLGELERRNHIEVASLDLNKSQPIGKVSGVVTLIK